MGLERRDLLGGQAASLPGLQVHTAALLALPLHQHMAAAFTEFGLPGLAVLRQLDKLIPASAVHTFKFSVLADFHNFNS